MWNVLHKAAMLCITSIAWPELNRTDRVHAIHSHILEANVRQTQAGRQSIMHCLMLLYMMHTTLCIALSCLNVLRHHCWQLCRVPLKKLPPYKTPWQHNHWSQSTAVKHHWSSKRQSRVLLYTCMLVYVTHNFLSHTILTLMVVKC